MTEQEFLFDLKDRIAKIQAIDSQYNLREKAYISFSGGKDSTILSHLIDLALPNNNIPRMFINTGIEYLYIRRFVESLACTDSRIKIINSGVNIRKMLNSKGYPFKSKIHSHAIATFQNSGLSRSVRVYLGEDVTKKGLYGYTICPKEFRYNFTDEFKIKCSDKCCYKLKKEVAHKYEKENGFTMCITGMRKEEGGSRALLSCISNKGKKFNPLVVVTEEWEDFFVEYFKIRLCVLYYLPYNFKRTGCKGCPFAQNLQNELNALWHYMPKEYMQCLHLWKPIYDEYIRIGYRLKYYPHEKEGKNENLI